ncbi:hypothetical protein JB92DRAFT_2870945, partial [Gautieria morchelliformis]
RGIWEDKNILLEFLQCGALFLPFKKPFVNKVSQVSLASLTPSTLQAGSQGRLVVDSVVNIGPHYARTLHEWRRRPLERLSSVTVPALMKEGQKEIEVFKRKWICLPS